MITHTHLTGLQRIHFRGLPIPLPLNNAQDERDGAEQLLGGKWPEPERLAKTFEVFHTGLLSIFIGSEVPL